MAAAFGVDIQSFLFTEMVTLTLAPFLVALGECLLADAADAVAVPECHDKVHPFLVAVRTLRTGEQFVHAGKGLVGQRNEIVLQRHHRFHVEIVLAAAQLQLLSYSVHGSIFPQIHPVVKAVLGDLHGIGLVGLDLANGTASALLDVQRIQDADIDRTKLVLSKMMVLLIFAIGFMAVGALVNLAVLLIQGWNPVGFWKLFQVGIGEGVIMWVGALPCMPLILIFGQIRGAYLGGSILAFFLGYSMMFFKGGILASIYPFSAALILVGFDMSEYAGTTTAPNPLLAVIGVGIMVLWAVLLLVMSSNKKEMKARKQTKAKGRGKRAVRRKGR